MPAWLLPAITGLASVGGSLFTNQSARRQSERQMEFQERMSSTAAQRAVKDYEKAGLNPALAYDRPASSPGGSAAPVENPAEKGISSAMAAMQMREQLKLVREQASKAQSEAYVAGQSARFAQSAETELYKTYVDEIRNRREILQPTRDLLKAQVQALRYENVGAKNEADLQQKLGIFGNILRFIKPR